MLPPGNRRCRAKVLSKVQLFSRVGVLVTAAGLAVLGPTGQKQRRELEKTQITPSSDASVPIHCFPLQKIAASVLRKGVQEQPHVN